MIENLRQNLPWWFKIAAKLVIKRFPYPYTWSQKLGLLRLGHMLDIQYAMDIFHLHYDKVQPYLPGFFTTLELGPGDSLASALLASIYGSRHTWLVDVGRFASTDITKYNDFLAHLARQGVIPAVHPYADLAELLQDTHTEYLTNSLESLRSIPDASVDFVFSQAVLEHVPLSDASATIQEIFRIQPAGGTASHRIDLKDHLSKSLNSLRFSRKVWESKYFRTSDFYTNRLRASQWHEIFAGAGYRVLAQHNINFPTLPLPRSKMQAEFGRFSDEDLMVASVQFILQK